MLIAYHQLDPSGLHAILEALDQLRKDDRTRGLSAQFSGTGPEALDGLPRTRDFTRDELGVLGQGCEFVAARANPRQVP